MHGAPFQGIGLRVPYNIDMEGEKLASGPGLQSLRPELKSYSLSLGT